MGARQTASVKPGHAQSRTYGSRLVIGSAVGWPLLVGELAWLRLPSAPSVNTLVASRGSRLLAREVCESGGRIAARVVLLRRSLFGLGSLLVWGALPT